MSSVVRNCFSATSNAARESFILECHHAGLDVVFVVEAVHSSVQEQVADALASVASFGATSMLAATLRDHRWSTPRALA